MHLIVTPEYLRNVLQGAPGHGRLRAAARSGPQRRRRAGDGAGDALGRGEGARRPAVHRARSGRRRGDPEQRLGVEGRAARGDLRKGSSDRLPALGYSCGAGLRSPCAGLHSPCAGLRSPRAWRAFALPWATSAKPWETFALPWATSAKPWETFALPGETFALPGETFSPARGDLRPALGDLRQALGHLRHALWPPSPCPGRPLPTVTSPFHTGFPSRRHTATALPRIAPRATQPK